MSTSSPIAFQAEANALARVQALHAETPYDAVDDTICSECTRINRYGVVAYPCSTAVAMRLRG